MPSEQNGSKRQILSRKGSSSHKTVNQFFVCLLNLGYVGILHTHGEVCAENHKWALSLELLILVSNTVDGDQYVTYWGFGSSEKRSKRGNLLIHIWAPPDLKR